MSDVVQPEGSRSAKFVLCGEAPGRWEMEYGRPFVGPSYKDKILPCWNGCTPKLTRDQFYIDNVLQYQPANIHSVPEREMRAAMDALHDRLALLDDPWLIVPVGNVALYTLTGNGVVSFHSHDGRWKRPGILEWRGSILQYVDKRGRKIKVIPTPHPAFTFRSPEWDWVSQADWQRIATDGLFRELRLPERTHMIAPSASEAIEWMRWTRAEALKRKGGALYFERLACSLDVETPNKTEYETRQKESTAANGKCKICGHTKRWHTGPPEIKGDSIAPCKGLRGKGGCECPIFQPTLSKPRRVKISEDPYLGCIGYAWTPKLALCIPTTLEYWQDPTTWARVKAEMAAFHADENIDFGGQNFGFDAWWCADEGMPLVHGWKWDLRKMHNVRVPYSAWHDLAFQASLYTRQPFWKHESKLPDEISRWSHNKQQLWDYNCVDNGVQIELLPSHVNALRAGGRLEYYEQLEAPIDPGLLELSRVGFRVDESGRKAHYVKCIDEARTLSVELNRAAEMSVVGVSKKGIITGKVPSPSKLKVFLYEKLRLPLQYVKNAKKEKKVSTNVVTIKRLMDQFPALDQLQVVGKMVLRHRRLNTEAQFVKESRVSKDGRIYSLYKQDTLLGRLSSSQTPRGEGSNGQNVDRRLRRFYLPDRGNETE